MATSEVTVRVSVTDAEDVQALIAAAKRVRSEKRAFQEGIRQAEMGGPMPDSKGLSEADVDLFAALEKLGV